MTPTPPAVKPGAGKPRPTQTPANTGPESQSGAGPFYSFGTGSWSDAGTAHGSGTG